MRNRVVPGLIALSVLAATPAMAQVSVLSQVFEAFVTGPDGNEYVYNPGEVPVEETSCYYWYLQLADAAETVSLVEDFQTPGPTDFGDAGGKISVGSDRITTRRDLVPDETGWVSSGWCAYASDPLGEHVIEIRDGAELLASFSFTAVAPEDFELPDEAIRIKPE